MAEGQGRAAWARTALLAAILANAHRDPRRTRAFEPKDFDPYARGDARRRLDDGTTMEMIKQALTGRKG